MARNPVETVADQLFYTTVFIESFNESASWTGTGFVINYQFNGEVYPVLITNKHVFEGAQQAAFTMVRADGGGPSTSGTRLTVVDFGPKSWAGHPDSAVDVAAMFLGGIIQGMSDMSAPAFYKGFAPEQLASQAEVDELDSIEQVTFVGYPNGLFDSASMLPIARRGQTATPIFNNYNALPAFLIDASIFPGSSGSPVVLFDKGTFTTRDGTTHVGTRLSLLGVVAAVHTRKVQGEVQMVSQGVATFDDMIDLGIVFKSSAIQECVFSLFEGAGLPLPVAVPAPEQLA